MTIGRHIDCEVHTSVTYAALGAFLDEGWLEYLGASGYGGPRGRDRLYPPNAPTTVQERLAGTAAGTDVAVVREHVLDAGPVDLAVTVPSPVFDLDQIWHPGMATAYAQATNDWTRTRWLDQDPRIKGSIVVPARDVEAMVAEIERVGDHPGFVQVVLPVRSENLYGSSVHRPLLAAAAARGLVIALHPGGFPGNAPTPTGWPSYYVEELAGLIPQFSTQLASLVSSGAFQRHPELRVVVLEAGFTWVPAFLWRFDQEWRGIHRETPWLSASPSSVIREHVRFVVQPVDAGSAASALRTYTWLESDDMLVYGSDYPHEHGGPLAEFLEALGDERRERLLSANARDLYGFSG